MVRISFACCFFFLICHAIAREIPNSPNTQNQTETKTLVVENNKKTDLPKNNDEVNNDNKNFIKFGGIGAAGGIGGVAGIVPIDYLGKGLGAGIMPMPMMPLPGGGLGGIGGGTGGGIGGGGGAGGVGGGGAGGVGGGGGGVGGGGGGGPGCPTPISKGGLVTTHP